jgi:hypothetical protein
VVVVSGSVYLVGEARSLLGLQEGSNDERASQSAALDLSLAHQPHPERRSSPLFTAVCGSLALLVSLVDKKGNVQHRIARSGREAASGLSGSRLTVRGDRESAQVPGCVYASNHTSYMDTPVIFASLPLQFRILARRNCGLFPS